MFFLGFFCVSTFSAAVEDATHTCTTFSCNATKLLKSVCKHCSVVSVVNVSSLYSLHCSTEVLEHSSGTVCEDKCIQSTYSLTSTAIALDSPFWVLLQVLPFCFHFFTTHFPFCRFILLRPPLPCSPLPFLFILLFH